MKICSKCNSKKELNEFNFKNKSLNTLQSQCKECTRLLIKNHYNKNKEYYLSKTRNRNKSLRNSLHSFVLDYLSKHPCVDCKESDLVVLEFDHKGLIPKFKTVSQLIRERFPLEVIKEEISKCEVRCANCHKRKTAKDFNWFKNIK